MSRLSLDRAALPAASQAHLDAIQQAFGTVPAMFRAAAHSPAALASLWGAFGALGGGRLPTTLTETLAVAIANRNQCSYCLAAHTALGRKAGVASEALVEAQAGRSTDARTAAALRFALAVVERRGPVSDADWRALDDAGFTTEERVELLAHVALNVFTNYLNLALDVPVDFPAVPLRQAA
ncbi:MAG: carboxymuconolactone decarboxylase family protein [Silanimonas sp.]